MGDDDRQEILTRYQSLRVADVRDGMDTLLLHWQGSMSPEMRPLWRTRACGIARTVLCVPYTGEVPKNLSPHEYWEWSGWYYREVCSYPWMAEIQPGDFIVIDQSGVNAGMMGSNNTLDGIRRGARGYASNGGVRDTDEIILQKVPFWAVFTSQSMVQGRLQYKAHDIPVTVGGVLVNPGDMVVADGDGVIVVPRALALQVAEYAEAEHKSDMEARRKHYQALGLELDDTV